MKLTIVPWLAPIVSALIVLTTVTASLGQDATTGQSTTGTQSNPPQTPPATEATAPEATAPEAAPPAVPAADELPRDFAGLKQKWTEVQAKLVELKERFGATAEVTEKDTIRTEYTGLLTQANNVIDRLRDASLQGLSADNLDPDKLNTLLGILLNDANSEMDERVLATADSLIPMGVPKEKFETAAKAERLAIPAREIFEEVLIRQREFAADDLPRAKITTNRGVIEIELFENEAPNTVANFISLAKANFYTGLKFHRVLEGFMAQGGMPNEADKSGPGYTIACECQTPEARRHFTGSLSMAHAGRDTGGSQFFITFGRTPDVRALDAKHTVFGRVINGWEVLDLIMRTHQSSGFGEQPIEGAQPDVIESIEIIRDRGHEYIPVKIGEAAAEKTGTGVPPPAQPGTDNASKKDGEGAAADATKADGNGAAGGTAVTGGDGLPNR